MHSKLYNVKTKNILKIMLLCMNLTTLKLLTNCQMKPVKLHYPKKTTLIILVTKQIDLLTVCGKY